MIVIGAGIIGAACAQALARRGLQVLVLDAGLHGATAAGMGHLLVLDDNPAELALSNIPCSAGASRQQTCPTAVPTAATARCGWRPTPKKWRWPTVNT